MKAKFKTLTYIGLSSSVRVYNPNLAKVDLRTISGYFIVYAVNSKRYRFYCPSNTPKIVEVKHVIFLKDRQNNKSEKLKVLYLRK